ncbi:MAG: hypothetical protein NZ750_01050 [Anaerolineae bacterium]|nr:hypothetical protein [Anaerolineae bacterium]MDW8173172.1 hypothetical protein [Anaerolineae bacterium]
MNVHITLSSVVLNKESGWKPISVYSAATVFNTALALLLVSLIFGVLPTH